MPRERVGFVLMSLLCLFALLPMAGLAVPSMTRRAHRRHTSLMRQRLGREMYALGHKVGAWDAMHGTRYPSSDFRQVFWQAILSGFYHNTPPSPLHPPGRPGWMRDATTMDRDFAVRRFADGYGQAMKEHGLPPVVPTRKRATKFLTVG